MRTLLMSVTLVVGGLGTLSLLPLHTPTNPVEHPTFARSAEPTPDEKPGPGLVPWDLKGLFRKTAKAYDLDPVLLAAVAYQESRFRSDRCSKAGACGLMQFMPGTADHYDVDVSDPASSIEGAARYLNHLLQLFEGNTGLALAAYNWGEGNVRKWRRGKIKSVPKETRDYVFKITGKSLKVWSGKAKSVDELMANLADTDHQQILGGDF